MTLRHKVGTILLVWLSAGAATLFAFPQWWLKLILPGIMIGVTHHLPQIKSALLQAAPSHLERQSIVGLRPIGTNIDRIANSDEEGL